MNNTSSMAENTIVLITGANSGIGFEAVKALLASDRAYHILMGSRSMEKANQAIATLEKDVPQTSNTVEPVQIDVTNDESITRAFEAVKAKYHRIDVLVNNAGALFDSELKQGSISIRESWNKTFDVNVSGAYVTTHTFMPLLLASPDPRLLFVTSGLSSLSKTSAKFYPQARPPPAGWPKEQQQQQQQQQQHGAVAAAAAASDTTAYRSAKTALNMMMLNLAFQLTEDGVKTWCVSPGFLATGLGGMTEEMKRRGAGDPSVGGVFMKDVIEGRRDDHVGKIVHSDGSVQAF
ncbi:hypothetical protein F4778DRAFT_758809 [Xylariomycetidae sp. FL2044]|nr:hypothetical protein F4778DRAFT_758809 [Xylariomycetidae sp. FL2044]